MIRVDLPARWALPALAAAPLNSGFARVVLEGQVAGRCWADRLQAPRAMHALHPYGMSLVWGEAVADALEPVVAHLREGRYRSRDEWLQIDPRWQGLDWDRRLGAVDGSSGADGGRCVRHTRVNFGFDAARFRARAAELALPGGWRLRAAAAVDFALPGAVVPGKFWDDAGGFLAAGGGWCAEQDGRVGAIAFVSYRWGDEAEIGIETFEWARRQGLGRAVAARMIADVLEAGLTPVWSCRLENRASCALALGLGFEPVRSIAYYRLSAADRHPPW